MADVRCRGAVVGAMLAALTAGCTGSSGGETEAAGPLSAYLADYQLLQFEREQAGKVAAADEVAACMKAQGFDYTPDADSLWQAQLSESPEGAGTLAWATEHGYGIADGSAITTETAPPDLNATAYAALSSAEREAWDAALQGEPDDPEDGCVGPAMPRSLLDDPTLEHWLEASADIEARVDDDAAVADARVAWSDCMAGAGFAGLSSPDQARAEAWEAAGLEGGSAADPEALAAERTLATADLGCDEEAGYTHTREATVERLQTAFVDEHRAELEAWRASWEAAG